MNQQKVSKKKIGMRGAVLIILVVTALTVTATVIPFWGTMVTTANLPQAITIDGHPFDVPIVHDIPDPRPGCCYCWEHTITNIACEGDWLDWESGGDPNMEGVEIIIYEKEPDCCTHILESLEIDVLDGQAQWDDFEVYVDGVSVYTYGAQGGAETWIMHTIDLTPWQFPCCGQHLIEIDCTASQPWTHFNPYGQLAVNTIDLYCEDHVWCDGVDIGKPPSEAGHSLVGWGPIEPANTGGNYGGIDDCRCTWFWTQGDTMPNSAWYTADGSWASVILTCEECYPDECNCEHEPMETPFWIDPESSIDICYCIKFSTRAYGPHTIYSQLMWADL